MNLNVGGIDRGSVPAWLILGFGGVFAVLALVLKDIPSGLGLAAGVLVVAVGLWDTLVPSTYSAAGAAVGGLCLFVLPWFGGFAGSSASWIAWIFGALVALCAAWSWASHPTHPSR